METSSVNIEEAFRDHLGAVYRYCLRMTGNVSEAEDLTQDTFLCACRQAGQYRGESQVKTWLFGIAHHRVVRHLRRKRLMSIFQPGRLTVSDCSDATDLMELIASLPPKQREAFLLVKVEGFTCSEAADALKLPIGTVKDRVLRAVSRLQALFDEEVSLPEEAAHAP